MCRDGIQKICADWAFLEEGLKRQALNGASQTEGECRRSSTGSLRKIKSFLNITACKYVLAATQNTGMNLKMIRIGPL